MAKLRPPGDSAAATVMTRRDPRSTGIKAIANVDERVRIEIHAVRQRKTASATGFQGKPDKLSELKVPVLPLQLQDETGFPARRINWKQHVQIDGRRRGHRNWRAVFENEDAAQPRMFSSRLKMPVRIRNPPVLVRYPIEPDQATKFVYIRQREERNRESQCRDGRPEGYLYGDSQRLSRRGESVVVAGAMQLVQPRDGSGNR